MEEKELILDKETTNETNCLALTIQKDYHLVVARNIFHKTARMSWKVALSMVLLNIMAILF